jgi:shikimate kinase
MSGPVVVLVGAPGAGKTTVGRLLATRLGLTFRDTDADVERVAGKAIGDIFVEDGEPAFRTLEHEALRDALAEPGGVLAVGGGAVLDPATRRLLGGHPVVFLDVGLADAVRRVGLNRDRPLQLGNPRAQLRKLLEARLPFYREVAEVTVRTDGLRPPEVADAVLAALGVTA